ncbi:MAG: amidase, partial [Rhabdochlamydiaceae bacterium]
MDLLFQSAKELSSNIIHKKVSAVEVTQAFVDQIEKVNPLLNAVVQFFPERALQEAKEADERHMRGNKVGLLHGVPMTVKDTCDVTGFICTMGTQGYKNNLVYKDATAVARLRQAGAIILGVTNMPECAVAFESDNLNYGRTNNPHDLKRTPGGSSGGEAAIIAAGGSPLGLGADGGGSIRLPAHFCGIAGIKPTQGRIPQTGLLIPRDGVGVPSIVGAFGPLARYVDDLYLARQVLCGPDKHDPHTVPMTLNDFHKVNLASLKVGFYVNNGVKNPSKDIQDAVIKSALFMAQDIKASVEEIQAKYMEHSYELLWELYFEGGDGGVETQQFLKSIGTKK